VELVGQIGGTISAVAVEGSYAYVGVGPRLVVLDISDPTHPAFVGQTGVLPGIADVAVSASTAYVADGDAGLRVVDVSNPATPTELGFYDTPGYARGVVVSGSTAYVADRGIFDGSQRVGSGLRVVDVGNPASPTEIGYYATAGGLGVWPWPAARPTWPMGMLACGWWM